MDYFSPEAIGGKAEQAEYIFNTPLNVVVPQKGEIYLFSSGLQHLVEANQGKIDRYSIAFNAFIRGKLGNYMDVSELDLK